MKLEPGMVFECERIDHTVAVVLLSKEPDKDWLTAEFQYYVLGAQIKSWPESVILEWKYIGKISDFEK